MLQLKHVALATSQNLHEKRCVWNVLCAIVVCLSVLFAPSGMTLKKTEGRQQSWRTCVNYLHMLYYFFLTYSTCLLYKAHFSILYRVHHTFTTSIQPLKHNYRRYKTVQNLTVRLFLASLPTSCLLYSLLHWTRHGYLVFQVRNYSCELVALSVTWPQ